MPLPSPRLTTSQKIGAGFVAALLILVVGALSLLSARGALDAARWVAHTYEVRGHLAGLLASLTDVETGERGYVITGATEFLQPYHAGLRRVPVELATLRRLTADNPRQQARLDALQPVVDARLAFSRAVIDARRTDGAASAAALLGTRRGKALMDDARLRLAALDAEESALLARRTTARTARERLVALDTLLGSLAAFVLVALMIRVIQQDVALQRRTAAERDALLGREQAARAQLAAIQRITDAALAPLALDDLLSELMRRLRAVLAVDTACVHLVMRDGVHLELCKCVGPTEEIAPRVHVPVGRGVIGGIAARREAAAVDSLADTEVYDPVIRERFASLLGAPLMVPARAAVGGAVGDGDEERVIGVVHVETLAPRHFSAEETTLLELVAERAASAIERARLYQAERRAEARYRLVIDRVRDHAIFTLDARGHVATWNAGAERLEGWPADAIVGQALRVLYPPDARARGDAEAHLREAETRGHWTGEGWRLRHDGSVFWAEVALTALRDEDDGHLLGFAQVTRDLTERRRADEALLAAKEAAEAASAAKSQFLATMSHEIRTPINAVLGYADLLDLGLDGALTAAQQGRVARIRASARHLSGLVNELLDLARIEAEQLHVERVRAAASEAAATALGLVYPQATARGLRIANRCLPGDDGVYLGDPHRVEQVLVNLLSNAVKFTPAGGRIEVACGLTHAPDAAARLAAPPDDGAGCWCWVRVSDSGPGIAAEMREAIFDPFVQADRPAVPNETAPSPYTRTQGGTGLGLAISRRLARLMGGDVTLDSTPGEGSTFTLWLPAPPDVRPPAAGGPVDCAADERPTASGASVGLARAGQRLRDRVPQVVAATVRRLRAEVAAPNAATLPETELEDHLGTLLAELARALVLIEEAEGRSTRTLRDGSEIQRVLAERHGVQRAALGWSEADHQREYAILQEEVGAALRGQASGAAEGEAPETLDAALDVVARLLAQLQRSGERARRVAAS